MYRFLTLALPLALAACAPKTVYDLSETEQRQLNTMLDARNKCLVSEAEQLDDGATDVTKIAEVAIAKCSFYGDNIQNTLTKEFGMKLGPAWGYVNSLNMQAPTQVSEALLTRRKNLRQPY